MDVEGPLPLGIKGGMVGTMVDGVGSPLMGSFQTTTCAVVMGPLEGITMMMGGKDVGPPPTIPLWKGSRYAPSMGIDKVVKKGGSD